MTANEPPDYHALDQLYAIQSEERQERRGLETRAAASIAAALTAVAFSANAISDRLSVADVLPIVLLAVGACLVFGGVLLSTSALMGGSSVTIRNARRVAAALSKVNLITLPVIGVSISLDRELDRARIDVDDAARVLRLRVSGGQNAKAGVEAERVASALAAASKLLQKLAGTGPVMTPGFIGADTTQSPSAQAPGREPTTAQSPEVDDGLREPGDLEAAMRKAEWQARRLRDDNSAAILVLKVSTALVSLGVLILVAGVVLLLAQPVVDLHTTQPAENLSTAKP
jgi:hypothetical protein